MRINQKGFGAVGAVAILACLLVIGFAGWYVWNKQHNDTDENNTSQKSKSTDSQTGQQSAPDPTADWVGYSNAEGKFSFKHPGAWVFADRPETCAAGLVLFASIENALGRCASETLGQMAVWATDGDVRDNYRFGQGFIDIKETNVTVNNVPGVKQTATASGQEGAGVVPDGTKDVRYVFYAHGRTYVAEYIQRPTYPDALNDFETLVNRTLKFAE